MLYCCRLASGSRHLVGLLVLLNAGLASGACGVTFLFPTRDQTFRYLDTVNVTYQSNFSSSTLFTWCDGSKITQQAAVPASPFNASTLVKLDFKSPSACWFDLRPNTGACGDNSPHFTILPAAGSQATVGLPQPSPTVEKISTPTPTPPKNITILVSDNAQGSKGLSTGAQVGIGIGVSIVVGLLVGGLAVFVWLRRQSKPPENGLLLRRSQDIESTSRLNGKTPPPHDPVHHPNSGSLGSTPGGSRLDDAYFVGYLPGFYGSARESGSNHNVSAPSIDPSGSVAGPSGGDAGRPRANLHLQQSYPVTGGGKGSETAYTQVFDSSDAELPGPESHRGYGEEFELPARSQQQAFGIPRREAQEQKFLLHDMELFGLKAKGPPRSS